MAGVELQNQEVEGGPIFHDRLVNLLRMSNSRGEQAVNVVEVMNHQCDFCIT